MEQYMIPCIFKNTFGIPCPGCGGQRSVLHLLHGEFGEAFIMYPAIYPLLLFCGIFITHFFIDIKNYNALISITSIATVIFILVNYGIELFKIF